MISPRRAVASLILVALSASAYAQEPAKPKPRKVTITYKAKGGGTAKAEGTIAPRDKSGKSVGTSIATPRAAGGYASVVPYVLVSPRGEKCVAFNAFDSTGKLVATTNPSFAADAAGNIGNGTSDINAGATGLAQGFGIGIMQFTAP